MSVLRDKEAQTVGIAGTSRAMGKSTRGVVRVCTALPVTDVDCAERTCSKSP
jgi:uncharacterized NAD-dependent epimerase/dehydratase family protein